MKSAKSRKWDERYRPWFLIDPTSTSTTLALALASLALYPKIEEVMQMFLANLSSVAYSYPRITTVANSSTIKSFCASCIASYLAS